jgi:hypothetical protein
MRTIETIDGRKSYTGTEASIVYLDNIVKLINLESTNAYSVFTGKGNVLKVGTNEEILAEKELIENGD